MKIRLLSLVLSKELPLTRFAIKMNGSLRVFADNPCEVEKFDNLKDLFTELSTALTNSDLVAISVDPKVYNSTKLKLMKALSLNEKVNEAIQKKLLENDVSDDVAYSEALFPENAAIFETSDGVNSGFAVKKGMQEILYIPLAEGKIDEVLRKGVIPYLTANKPVSQEFEKEELEQKIIEDKTEEPTTLIDRTMNILRESNSFVAVAGSKNADFVKAFGEGKEGFSDLFVFTPMVSDNGDYNVVDFTAQTAKSAKDLAAAKFGAAISEIKDTETASYLCVVVAGEESATVRKLYKEQGESDIDFLKSCAEELIQLIGQRAGGNDAYGIEIKGEQEKLKNGVRTTKMSKTKKAVIWLVVIIVLAGISGTGYYFKDKIKTFFVHETTTTVPISSTEKVTEETTVPVNTETVKLSELMRKEQLNGVNSKDIENGKTVASPSQSSAVQGQQNSAENKNGAPANITLNGVVTDGKDAVAKLVAAEISDSANSEAIKAQAIIIYTYLTFRDTNYVISGVTAATSYSDNIKNAVEEVYGKTLTYQGKAAFTPYFAVASGKTTTAESVYGKSYPYITSVSSIVDRNAQGYETKKTYSKDELKSRISAFDQSLVIPDDASKWLSIKKHDASVNSGTGYVTEMEVCGRIVSGVDFVQKILSNELPSHCFTISFDSVKNEFTITSYGRGLGVGLSIYGADSLAKAGQKYDNILGKFYPGTKLS